MSHLFDPIHVTLAFDPMMDSSVREVFLRDKARIFWLLWRRHFLVSDSFAEEAIIVGAILSASKSREEFVSLVSRRDLSNVLLSDLDSFTKTYWAHLSGEAVVLWETKKP